MIIGISMGRETCQILGRVSQNLLYWKKKSPDGFLWSRERLTRKQLTYRPDHLGARNLENNEKECQAEGEAKVVE